MLIVSMIAARPSIANRIPERDGHDEGEEELENPEDGKELTGEAAPETNESCETEEGKKMALLSSK